MANATSMSQGEAGLFGGNNAPIPSCHVLLTFFPFLLERELSKPFHSVLWVDVSKWLAQHSLLKNIAIQE